MIVFIPDLVIMSASLIYLDSFVLSLALIVWVTSLIYFEFPYASMNKHYNLNELTISAQDQLKKRIRVLGYILSMLLHIFHVAN